MYHIQIVGAGYTGSAVAKYFLEKKQKVTVIKRTAEGTQALRDLGATVLQTDLRNPDLPTIPSANFIVISLAPENRTEEAYRKTYLEAVHNYLTAIQKNQKPLLIVYLSSTGVFGEPEIPSVAGLPLPPKDGSVRRYATDNDVIESEAKQSQIIDESVIANPQTERAKILLEAERQILESGYPSLIFRLSGIYGPSRNRIKSVLNGEWPPPHPEKIINMIHVDDIVQSIPILFNQGQAGSVYLGVDDEPVLEGDFYSWLSQKLGVSFSREKIFTGKAYGKKYNNGRLKSLGIAFKYPNFRMGYQQHLLSS